MNIVEALKSGKPFRRKSMMTKIHWWTEIYDDNYQPFLFGYKTTTDEGCRTVVTSEDILADDWEVKEDPHG